MIPYSRFRFKPVYTFRQLTTGATISPTSLAAALARGAPIDVHPEVQDALTTQKAVVALETTIVTHGMPYPVNLDTARSVEANVRRAGAVPATIGMIGGRIKIGLAPNELERLADVDKDREVVKLSRRDIGPAIALKRDGGTTCSATLIFAALAGIKVFATGGLGGVHRGGENSMDVSADLQELTRCPVGLVSAGVKSILDIGRTLEYLETLGVPVVSYAETNDFPAFYTRRSGFKSPWRVDDPQTAAHLLHAQWALGMHTGALFGVPIPETYEPAGVQIQHAVEQAVREAEANGMSARGKEVTPWLLARVGEISAGLSLASNIALIENTAFVGGKIAVAYAELSQKVCETDFTFSTTQPNALHTWPIHDIAPAETKQLVPANLVVVGCSAVDITAQASPTSDTDMASLIRHSTVPGAVSLTLGGVARNMAEAAHRILSANAPNQSSSATALVSPVGPDSFGRLLVDETRRLGMRTDGLIHVVDAQSRSAVCNMVLDGAGGLVGGIADMDITANLGGDQVLEHLRKHKPSLVALDANLSEDTMKMAVRYCNVNGIDVFFEPTSIVKSVIILPAIAASLKGLAPTNAPIAYASPNLLELAQLYQIARSEPLDLTSHAHWWASIDSLAIGSQYRMELELLARRSACDSDVNKGTLSFLVEHGVAQMAVHLLPFFRHLVIKCGSLGVLTVFRAGKESCWMDEQSNVARRHLIAHGKTGEGCVVLKHYPALPLPLDDIVNVTGAGDSLVGSILASLINHQNAFDDPQVLDDLVMQAQLAAVSTLKSAHAVSPELSKINVLQ